MDGDFRFCVILLLFLLFIVAIGGIIILAQIENHLAFIASHTH